MFTLQPSQYSTIAAVCHYFSHFRCRSTSHLYVDISFDIAQLRCVGEDYLYRCNYRNTYFKGIRMNENMHVYA